MRNIVCLLVLFCLMFIYGCSDKQISIKVDKNPEVVHRESLPAFEGKFNSKKFVLETKLLISEDGNVVDVNLLNSSGDRKWDTSTISHLKKWKYTPAILNDQPISIWLRQSISVTVLDDYKMHLGEIVVNNLALSDSIYSKITEGMEFSLLAQQYSTSDVGKEPGDLGIVDIRKYPEYVQEKISRLNLNETTQPIKIDNLYYIIKKLPAKR
jgi:TonB family protein